MSPSLTQLMTQAVIMVGKIYMLFSFLELCFNIFNLVMTSKVTFCVFVELLESTVHKRHNKSSKYWFANENVV